MQRAIAIYFVLAFGFSWGCAELYYRLIQGRLGEASAVGDALLGLVFMYGPAVGAVVATRWSLGRPLRSLGPFFRFNRWLAAAIFAPMLFALGYVLLSPLLPGLEWAFDRAELTTRILVMVPEAQQTAVLQQLAAVGDWLPWALVAQVAIGGLISGLTITAVAAFGEELGWRGFLHQAWGHWNFWRRALVIGLIWGIWHAPLILRGHNYPDQPVAGVAMMVLFCVLLSPLIEFFRERSGALFAAVFFHGVLNATAGASVFVTGGSDLLRGPAGLAGCLMLVIGCLVVAWLRRRPPAAAAAP